MSDDLIFREVDEDVRRERMEALAKRYGGAAIAVALLIIVGVAGTVWWNDRELTGKRQMGAQFEAARSLLLAEDYAGAAAAFEALGADGSPAYRMLARIQAAEARALSGEGAAALATYQGLLDEGKASVRQQNLIRLKGALLALELEGGQSALAWLGDLPEADGAFRTAAMEIKASALLAGNDRAGAVTILRAIVDDADSSAAQRDRAGRFLLALGDK